MNLKNITACCGANMLGGLAPFALEHPLVGAEGQRQISWSLCKGA